MAVLITDLRASAAEYYLAPDGSDDAVGSVLQPWGSFDHALSQLEPGDVLTVSGGTYVERVKNARLEPATAEQPITVQAAPGERPVLKGLLWIRGMDHWRFDGINVTWGNGDDDEHMVKLTDGVGWEFLNAEVWGARSFAAILVATTGGSEPTDWRIAGNCVHDTIPTNSRNNDHLIYANSGHEGSGVIEHNLLFNAPNGNGVKLGGPSAWEGGASNVIVRRNTVYNTNQSILVAWQSRNNLIEHNILFGVSGNYANIRGYQLSGSGNRAAHNLGAASAGVFLNDPGYEAVADAGGNRHPIDPQFTSTAGCGGFEPTNPTTNGYGYTAVGPMADAGNRFLDDDGSVFETDIEKIALANITRGCGPALFCPYDAVTRGQMAAFLVRALHLTRDADGDPFNDDNGHIFEQDIERLAVADIARGCSPDRFCPDEPVTRGQMAAFLSRALNLQDSAPDDRFQDDNESIFEDDIEALALTDITHGCNPPDNNRFCPHRTITRAEMAAFLVRAIQP